MSDVPSNPGDSESDNGASPTPEGVDEEGVESTEAQRTAETAPPEKDAAGAPIDDAPEDATIIAPAAPEGDMAPGTVVSNTFRIRKLIGRGGMGQVYLAEHTFQETLHALKRISPQLSSDPQCMALFRREAELLRRVNSEAIVGYDGVIVHDEGGRMAVFLAMEFAEGPSLKSYVRDNGPLSPESCRVLLRRVATGLAAAHDKGVYHRDMSPENIILTGGAFANAKIIDFGIARDEGTSDVTLLGAGFAGKLGYAAPEQFGLHTGVIDARTDIYALGLSIYYAATGAALFQTKDIFAARERRMEPPDLDAAPEELRALLARMIAPDPADRFESMAAVVAALESPAAAQRTGSAPRTSRRPREDAVARPAPAADARKKSGPKKAPRGKRGWALPAAAFAAVTVIGLVALIAFSPFDDGARVRAPATPATNAGGPDASRENETVRGDRAALAMVREANASTPQCLLLPKADAAPSDGRLTILSLPLGEGCDTPQAALAKQAASAGLAVTYEDGSALVDDKLRAIVAAWANGFPSLWTGGFDIEFVGGEAGGPAQGIYRGAPTEFAARISYSGPRARLYADIIRFDGWLYREWSHDGTELGPGWSAATSPLLIPDRTHGGGLAAGFYETPPTDEYIGRTVGAQDQIKVGAISVVATDADLPCDPEVDRITLLNPELPTQLSVDWVNSVAPCLAPGAVDAFGLVPFVWIPDEKADEFLLR